jgi:hypothetical protein
MFTINSKKKLNFDFNFDFKLKMTNVLRGKEYLKKNINLEKKINPFLKKRNYYRSYFFEEKKIFNWINNQSDGIHNLKEDSPLSIYNKKKIKVKSPLVTKI